MLYMACDADEETFQGLWIVESAFKPMGKSWTCAGERHTTGSRRSGQLQGRLDRRGRVTHKKSSPCQVLCIHFLASSLHSGSWSLLGGWAATSQASSSCSSTWLGLSGSQPWNSPILGKLLSVWCMETGALSHVNYRVHSSLLSHYHLSSLCSM